MDIPTKPMSLKWFSLFSPPILWPLYGISLYEILSMEGIDTSLFTNNKIVGSIWRKRFGVKTVDRYSKESLIMNYRLYGYPETIIEALNRLSSLDSKEDLLITINGYNAFIYTTSGFDIHYLNKSQNKIKKMNIDIPGLYIYDNPWDLLKTYLNLDLKRILKFILSRLSFEEVYDGLYVKGNVDINDRYTYIDSSGGWILLFDDVNLEGFNFLKGPLVVGGKTLLSNSKIHNSIIGPVCKIGSEVSDSILLGYSNSAHFGYIGHSLIGYWVNIGAGTVFSDLKNTYGPMKFWFMGNRYDLGVIKFGSIVGDYAKTSINTSIYGGRFIGLSSHVSGLVSKSIPPFKIFDGWHDKEENMHVDKAIEIARRMYVRRGVNFINDEEKLFREVFKELKDETA